jgi:CubicO group peptidase (beta-lactamase class C family)
MRFIVILCCALLTVTASAQLVPVEKDNLRYGFDKDRLERLDKRMHRYVDEGKLAGVQSAIIRDGQLVHSDTYGYADLGTQTVLTEDHIWRIYSMTKPIASVGLMMLYEEGLFDLSDPVEKYIPAFKNMNVYDGENGVVEAKNKMTITDLLTHTSGIGYGWGGGYVDSLYRATSRRSHESNADFVNWLASQPLYFEPGTAWRYGLSTDVLGYLIEVLSGQSLYDYLNDALFQPLGMHNTYFSIPQEKASRLVTNYTDTEGDSLTVIDHYTMSPYTKPTQLLSAGGGLASTMGDYLIFSQMLLNGGEYRGNRYLSRKTLDLMLEDHCTDVKHHGGPVVMPGNGNGFGLGFSVVNNVADTNLLGSEGMYGWGGAAGTVFRIDPKENIISIMMIQLMPYHHLQARETFQNMVYQALIE